MPKPLVTIISVHFNQLALTESFIKSVLNQLYLSYELIIIDNGSLKEPIDPLIEKYPMVDFIISEENLGFAGGNNLGIEKAKGEFLFFLNNDTEIEENTIEILVEHFSKNPECGMLSPKIKYYDTNTLQYAGSGKVNLYNGRIIRIGYKEEDRGQFDSVYKTEIIHGAAMMVSRHFINTVGMMSSEFFLYYEEIDWCHQAKEAGIEIWFNGNSTVYHKESMSIGKNSPLKTYYMSRNRLLFMRRHTHGFKKISWIVFFILFSIPKNLMVFVFKKDWKNLKGFLSGVKWNLFNKYNFT
ncbi:glycosyltransferase family 2 protein [Marivirga sp.]|uniref:glycosyltransferase family 2 protein n=1 Tax=Marivirga sp. TaxID=2018662 RepID=UPI0025E5593E|nr:glycosyltransferase family 2 protein [Marivirga sp.]